MTNTFNKMSSLYPLSDETLRILKEHVSICHFPKKYKLIEANKFCKSAYFIEKGMTRSFWLVNGEEITTSFAYEGSIVFSMDELYYNKISESLWKRLKKLLLIEYRSPTYSGYFKTISNWPIGEESFIKTNTGVCTVHTKIA